jgi:hypothetical protein
MRLRLAPGPLTSCMFKRVPCAAVTPLHDRLPSAGESWPKLTTDERITPRLCYSTPSRGHPARRDRARGLRIWAAVQRHGTPYRQGCPSPLRAYLLFCAAPNARRQARRAAEAERKLYAVACKPLFGEECRIARAPPLCDNISEDHTFQVYSFKEEWIPSRAPAHSLAGIISVALAGIRP